MQEKLGKLHNILYAEKSKQYMFLALCTTIFVYGFMYRIIEFNTMFWCAVPFVLYFSFERLDKCIIDTSFLLLSTFSLIVAVIAYIREPNLDLYWSDVKLAWLFPTIYMLGVASVGHDSNKVDSRVLCILNSLNFGMFFQAVLDHLNRYRRPLDEFAWYAFWKDDYELRTVFDFGFIVMVSITYYAFKNMKNIKFCITVFACSLVGIIWSLMIKGRTILAVCVMCFFLGAFFDWVTSFKTMSSKRKRHLRYFFLIISGLLVVSVILFFTDSFGIKTLYQNSFLSRDGGLLHNVRIQAAKDGLQQALQYPQGGWYGSTAIPDGGTHNTWLEFARYYNTFVFVLLTMYVFITIKNMLKVVLNKKYSDVERFYLCSVAFTLFFYMTIEPVGANPSYYYVLFFIYVSGLVTGSVATKS